MYGEDVAILAGDALLSTSFQHVTDHTPSDAVPAERIVNVISRLGQSVGAKGLAGGQVMDLLCEAKSDATLDELRWIHTHKTAALLQVAVSCGAVLAGATDEEVEACEEFALKIGLAFQVADDILDVTQSTEELVKRLAKTSRWIRRRTPSCWDWMGHGKKRNDSSTKPKRRWNRLVTEQRHCWRWPITLLIAKTKPSGEWIDTCAEECKFRAFCDILIERVALVCGFGII